MTKELNERGRQLRAQALFSRGTELLQKQQPEQALGLLQQAHKLEEGDMSILQALVILYMQEGRQDHARTYAEKLLAMDPENPQLQQWVGGILGR